MKKIFEILVSRVALVAYAIIMQVLILFGLFISLKINYATIFSIFMALSVMLVIWLINSDKNPTVKLPWVILIMILPVFGGFLYLIFGNPILPKGHKERISEINKLTKKASKKLKDSSSEIKQKDALIGTHTEYIKSQIIIPPTNRTFTKYFPTGEETWEEMKNSLRQAKHFIFMEHFIVEEGKMWNEILDILVQKVKEGVDVRFMYDDIGCAYKVKYGYNKNLEELGIKCKVFNPLRPSLSVLFNYRDHRKITVIDGHTGFTGGINLADEYINETNRYGHWKDCGIMLKGEGVSGLTLMFLQMWNYDKTLDSDFSKYMCEEKYFEKSKGYVEAFMDTPLDDELLGETVYINMINSATDYVYINTPYFIIDSDLIFALTSTAKRGVNVVLVFPHKNDSWFVQILMQAYYPLLLEAGIKIYEYSPGFIHSKTFVVDDKIAVIGTINLDYRSLYHHFECGVYCYLCDAVYELKDDFVETLEKCELITDEHLKNVPFILRITRSILRLFAPLM